MTTAQIIARFARQLSDALHAEFPEEQMRVAEMTTAAMPEVVKAVANGYIRVG